MTLAGMPVFDAICNSFTIMAAGGFSPNPLSIMGYQNPTITWIVSLFMLLARANFALQYKFLSKESSARCCRMTNFDFILPS